MASGLHDELGLGGGQLKLDEDGARRLEVVAHASNKLAVVVRVLEEQSCRVCSLNRVYTSAVKRSRLWATTRDSPRGGSFHSAT